MNTSRYIFSDKVSKSVQVQSMELLDAWNFQSDARSIYIEPLEGGLNNVNLILTIRSDKWVLKIRPPDCELFGAAPESSLRAQKDAAYLGIAPKVIAVQKSEWHFISEYLVGDTLRPEFTRKNDLYAEIVQTLHILHGGHCSCREFSIFDDIRLFMKGVDNANIVCPPGFRKLLASAYKLESKLSQTRAPKGFCHNDLVPQNFIKCADGMRLVDFDYAGVGWIAVDLASATSQFEMTEDEVESFLLLYDGGLDDGQRGRLATLRFCNNIREISYTLFAEPLLSSTTATLDDLSYATHREFNLEQAQRACSDPAFNDKCNAASSVRQGALF